MGLVLRTLVWAWASYFVITLAAAHEVSRRDTSGGSKRVVCYYTNWSVYRPGTAKFNPQNINPYLCTHLIYAFGGLTRENGLRPYDKYQDIEQGGYAKFTGLKTYNKQLKTMLAIGGWNEGSSRFSPLVASAERRGEFVKNVVRFLRQNHFDGLDLDWEYPAFRDGGKSRDRENYVLLVQGLREEFDRESSKTGRPRLLLTMAVPAGIEYIDKGYDVPKLNKYLDFMNILSYDYHSSFEPSVNHHSPLYPLEEEGEYNFDAQLSIDYTINHYLKLGADPDKLVLGIPTYGRSYTLFNPLATEIGSPADGPGEQGDATREKGYLAYYEICENLQDSDEWKVEQPNPKAMGPYAYKGNQWVGYDDEDIVRKKARYVTKMGLGGIMYWAIDNDDFRGKCHGRPYPLIEAGKEAMLEAAGTTNEVVPAKGSSRPRVRPTTEAPPVRNSGGGTRKQAPKRRRPSKNRAQEKRTTSTSTTSTSTTPAYVYPAATPEPPTTPDPGSDFKCEDEGFFPHPRDCKKYFWCLDSGPSNLGIVAHQFTCPSGLFFNKAADSCDYTRNVICNKKSKETTTTTTTTTTAAPKTPAPTPSRLLLRKTTTTTTTTEEPEYEEEYEEYEDDEEGQPEEDPKAIKELIDLIKKLGGIENLEKQLHLDDGDKGKTSSVTAPAVISKNLYERVLSQANSRPNFYNPSSKSTTQHTLIFRNRGRQNEGLDNLDEVKALRYEKPQYVTIKRNRPTTPIPEDAEDEDEENEDNVDVVEAENPRERAYVNIRRERPTKVAEDATTTPKYVTIRRTKPSARPEVEDAVTDSPAVVSHSTRSPGALVQEITPAVTKKKYNFAPRTPKRGILTDSKEVAESDDVTVASEKEDNAEESVKVSLEDQKSEVSGHNQKKYVEISRGRGSTTASPTEAELTTVNIPSEPSSSLVDVNAYLYLSTVTDETLNDKTDALPVQTLLPTTSLEPTSAPDSTTKKSRFFAKASSSSTQSTTEGEDLVTETSDVPESSSSTPRSYINRNRFLGPSSTTRSEDADSLPLDNSTSATTTEDVPTSTAEVKRTRFFRPTTNSTQTLGQKNNSNTTNSLPPSPEDIAKRNRFFRPHPNKTQLAGAALAQNNTNSSHSPEEVTKRSRFYRPPPSFKQRTTDSIDTLSIESLFTSSTTSGVLTSVDDHQLTQEEKELSSTNNPSELPEASSVSTTTPFTPTVTRVVTSVTESGTTERQRILLSKYKGFYLTVNPTESSTPYTAYNVATEHTTQPGLLFANLTDKMEKIMEVNRKKQVTFTDDVALPFTQAISSQNTTSRPTVEVKSEQSEDKIKEITRLSHITVVEGDHVTAPTIFDTEFNSTVVPTEINKDQTNEISPSDQQDTTQSPSTPRLVTRGRGRVQVRGPTTRAPIPSGLRSSLQRRRSTTVKPTVDGTTDNSEENKSSRRTFVPRVRGGYRPLLKDGKDTTTESADGARKRFRPHNRNDEQDTNSGIEDENSSVPLYKSRGLDKALVTERNDEYSQEEQTTYEDDTNTDTDLENESDKRPRFSADRDNTNSGVRSKFTPQYKNRSRTKQVTENSEDSTTEKELKSFTRSQQETARLFPKLRTTQKLDKNEQDDKLKGVTGSYDEIDKPFSRFKPSHQLDNPLQDEEVESSLKPQEESVLRVLASDRAKSTSNLLRVGLQTTSRGREQGGSTRFNKGSTVEDDTIHTSPFTPKEDEVTSQGLIRDHSSTDRKRTRVLKKKRRRPVGSSSTASSAETTLTTSSPADDADEVNGEKFGQKDLTTSIYTTDFFTDSTTRLPQEDVTDLNTVFDESTPLPSESFLTTEDVKLVGGKDEDLDTEYSSTSLDSSRRGSQKFSLDSSEEDDSNDVKEDPSLATNFFKKYLTKTESRERESNSGDSEGQAGAKRRRVIKKKRLPSHDDKSTQLPEDSALGSLQTEVQTTTARPSLRRPGASSSFLANNRLRNRASSTTSSTTTTTTTEASTSAKPTRRRGPSLASRLNVVRRRKLGDNTTFAELPSAEKIIAVPTTLNPKEKEGDAVTVEPTRKFNFPRRRTKVISRVRPVTTTASSAARQLNDSLNEPSTIEDVRTAEPEDVSFEVEATTPLPDLANVAVAAIQQLAIQPSVRPSFKREKSIVGTKGTYLAHTATVSTTPRISTTLAPAVSSSATPFFPRRGTAFYVTPTTTPRLPNREDDPFKPRPFSKVNAAVLPNSQSSSVEDYEYYDTDALLDTMPSAGKVKIHSDGYIECLDQGSFPHPFSCKQFISCAKMENGDVLGWEYTCPRHLSFDPIGGICNWSAGLGCKE